MKNLNVSQPHEGGASASNFEAAKKLAFSLAESDPELFAESSSFDSYEHFGPGPFVNVRNAQGDEMICRAGGGECASIDEWTSKLT